MIYYSAKEYKKTPKILIVGTGPASISLALILEKKKVDCVLIEAGNLEYSPKLQETFSGVNNGNFDFDLRNSRIKQFGGSANIWGKRCRPLDPVDYKNWSNNEINLLKYQQEASEILHVKNEFDENFLNTSLSQVEFNYSEIDFPNYYLDKLSKSNFIDVILNSSFLKLKGKFGNFKSAEIIDNNSKIKYTINSDFFVFGCGCIENSRFLLLLQKKYKLLDQNIPIGKYWMGHFKTHFGELLADFTKLNLVLNKNDYLKKGNTAAIALNANFIENNNLENACVYLQPNQLSNTKFNQISKKLLCLAPEYFKHITKLFKKNLLCGTSLEIIWGQKSVAENHVKLSDRKVDFLNIPEIEIVCNSFKEDLDTPKKFMKQLGEYFVNENIGRLHFFNINKKDQIFWEGNHHIGGTNIGDDPKYSVINSDLKVHHTKNLYIIGSSIFSKSGHANPTFSIVQFSARLGEYFSKILT